MSFLSSIIGFESWNKSSVSGENNSAAEELESITQQPESTQSSHQYTKGEPSTSLLRVEQITLFPQAGPVQPIPGKGWGQDSQSLDTRQVRSWLCCKKKAREQ